ncbi:MAG TPA: protein kinase [Polyangiaceae bacterium]|nr:protein kinase [Polyangiaceae bacterium]
MLDPASLEGPAPSLKSLAPPKPPATVPPREPEKALPRKFGRLTLLSALAKGGMGEVFLATSGGIEGAERPCVVKIIRREHAEDPSFLARFFDEARIQAQLDHPGVARVLEASTDPSGKPFVVVEYVEGRNLAEVRNRGAQLSANVGWADAVALGVSLSEALAYVHERTDANGTPLGIVHRDLSPQNVMVGYGGDVKLIDFGTARGENRKCHTVSGVVLAKPGYVAPEVANNQPGGIPADLYALGIILWELVAGRRFLTGDTSAHVAAVAAGRRNPPPIAELMKAPPELDGILARLTAPRIEDRYASSRDVVSDLLRLLRKAPSLANGERSVRGRIAHLMERLYPAEPAKSRSELGRLIALARTAEPKEEPAPARPAASPAPAETDESLLAGTRYRILREIGRGAMGVVYEAHHVDLGRVVALKVLPRERCKSPEFETRFRREARAIARLKHENLVQLHDFGVSADGRPYYAMELLDGETLEKYLDRERGMDWREAARIGVETCRALDAAHEAGLVHRDIKPGNLFLTKDGRVKLLDFGVVQVAPEDETGDPEALRLIGTAEYMAPEQAAGGSVDARADLYALGAVLYELVTGRQPHVAGTTVALIDRKLRGAPETTRERAPGRGIPKALDRVIMKALARFPTQRYASASELGAALESAIAAPGRDRTMRRRIAALSLFAAACGIVAFGVKSARNPEVRARAAATFRPAFEKVGIHPLPAGGAPRAAGADEDPAIAVLYEAPKPAPEATVTEPSPKASDAQPDGDGEVEENAPSAQPTPVPAATDDSVESELAKADTYVKRGQYLYALTTYRKIGKLRSNDPRVLRGWSEAAVKTKGWGEALRVAIQWASQDSAPEAQLYLARIQHSAGQRYGAIATLTRLVEKHPDLREAEDLLDRYGEKKLASR